MITLGTEETQGKVALEEAMQTAASPSMMAYRKESVTSDAEQSESGGDDEELEETEAPKTSMSTT